MFRGVNTLNLDAKGRMAVPARYRELLADNCDNQLVVTVDPNRDPCLLIYPLPEWENIERSLARLPNLNKSARLLQRMLIGHATEVELDSQARILVPPPLRDVAGLDKHVVLIGQGNKLELWDEQRWNSSRDEWLADDSAEALELSAELETFTL
ncbi:MAG: division/cell wall cluster transcriptional repressor MraZ [Gammaproteobacteria bacterium]|nr:division/cell wall cluster transcriptional repressor MraZ [Gammaproteobacteria bacterium]